MPSLEVLGVLGGRGREGAAQDANVTYGGGIAVHCSEYKFSLDQCSVLKFSSVQFSAVSCIVRPL